MALSIAPSTADLESLLKSLSNLTPNDRALVERAYHRAETAHEGQVRKSGERYFTHCLAVANILADMSMDSEAIAAGLLHDTVEDTEVTYEDLESEFGKAIADMVDGVTKLRNLPINVDKENIGKRTRAASREHEYIRKMLLAMDKDIRVVLVKLADRLHNMRTLGYMPEHKQARIAKETMEIFAPLANRLGIWQLKWELEDLSFRYMEPLEYRKIAAQIDERRADREAYLEGIIDRLRHDLVENNVHNVLISARPKHIYSIHRKMQRKQLDFDQIFDVRAVRVIVENVPQCYQVLGIVHNIWRPVATEFDDYIAAPKDNFYQSLHTAVHDENGKMVEVQIRTREMHEHAEYGVAAHWRYKEGRQHDPKFQERLAYIRRLMEFGEDDKEDADAFVDAMKSEVFQDRVYVHTPKGDIVDLPAGATPIDFAYHIHTEIGHRCRGAKVNGKLVSLNHELKIGDKLEIITSKRGGPSMDWLNPHLGYVHTSRARSKIRYWFRKLNRDKHISLGRDVLERELKRLGVMDSMTFETVANQFDFARLDDFLAAVGAGDINAGQIAHRLADIEHEKKLEDVNTIFKTRPRSTSLGQDDSTGIKVMGTGGLMVNFANCCNPMSGDEILGYITRGRGVTVHRNDCPNILSISDKERLIDVSWGSSDEEQHYAVPIEVVAYDREGLMRDVSTVIADLKINLSDVKISTRNDIATFHLTMEISNPQQLTTVLARISLVHSVVDAYRCNPA